MFPGLVDDRPLSQDLDPDAVEAAAAMVRNFCGWHIAPAVTEELVVDGARADVLLLPTAHVTAVTAVVENGVLLAAADYDWSQSGYLVRRGRWWTDRARGLKVSLTHGYDSCPPEVRAVVARVARAGLTPTRVTSVQRGPFAVTMDAADAGVIDADSQRILERYLSS